MSKENDQVLDADTFTSTLVAEINENVGKGKSRRADWQAGEREKAERALWKDRKFLDNLRSDLVEADGHVVYRDAIFPKSLWSYGSKMIRKIKKHRKALMYLDLDVAEVGRYCLSVRLIGVPKVDPVYVVE